MKTARFVEQVDGNAFYDEDFKMKSASSLFISSPHLQYNGWPSMNASISYFYTAHLIVDSLVLFDNTILNDPSDPNYFVIHRRFAVHSIIDV